MGILLCIDRCANGSTECSPDNRTVTTTDLVADCCASSTTKATTNRGVQG